jgi:AcrR family transcriptional regulator
MRGAMAERLQRGEGRAALLAAAAAELVERDGALEVLPVAARAGVSVGLIYRHFGAKSGLLGAIVEDFHDRFDAQVLAIDPAPDASWAERERIRTGMAVAFHYDDPLAPVVLGRLARDPEVAAVEAFRLRRQIRLAARNIDRGQRAGEIPGDLDPGLAAAMTLGGVRQALGEVLDRPRRPPREVVADQLWRLVVAAVRCDIEGSPR